MRDFTANDTLTLQVGDDRRMHPVTYVGRTAGGLVLLQASRAVLGDRLPGSVCTVRYIAEGRVCGFRSKLVKVLESPERLLFLEAPADVEAVEIRQSRRYPMVTFGTLHLQELELPVMLRDVSRHGCMVRLSRQAKALRLPQPPFDAELGFLLPVGGDVRIRCRVRRATEEAGFRELGLEFDAVESGQQDLDACLQHIAAYFD